MRLFWWRKPTKTELPMSIDELRLELRGIATLMLDIRNNKLSRSSDQFLRRVGLNPLDYLGAKADIPMPDRSKPEYYHLDKNNKLKRAKPSS